MSGEERHHDQHGWTGTSNGQYFRGAAVAHGEVRIGLSPRLRGGPGGGEESGNLFWVLQSRASASGFGLSDAGRDALWKTEMLSSRAKTGDAVGRARWNRRSWGFLARNSSRKTIRKKRGRTQKRGHSNGVRKGTFLTSYDTRVFPVLTSPWPEDYGASQLPFSCCRKEWSRPSSSEDIPGGYTSRTIEFSDTEIHKRLAHGAAWRERMNPSGSDHSNMEYLSNKLVVKARAHIFTNDL